MLGPSFQAPVLISLEPTCCVADQAAQVCRLKRRQKKRVLALQLFGCVGSPDPTAPVAMPAYANPTCTAFPTFTNTDSWA